ncbi:MAG TPA: C40 family peptidase [Gemmatimonadaceae bacterium]|jgi:cell wall-associated NlpC family hydrolase|nr:C40 family peptidase [Gemmatimonadaceae bacterium]
MPISHFARSLRRVLCPLAGCVLVASSVAGAQAARADSSRALDARKPFARWSESVHTVRDSLVAVARAQVGTKYVLGGTTPTGGFDCSGLVKYVMAALRVELPRTAAQQARVGSEISRDDSRLRPGDLLTFGKKGKSGVSHIGIYIGDGRYIHASSVAGRVIESDLHRTGSPLIRAWRGVRRVVSGTESDSTRNGDG